MIRQSPIAEAERVARSCIPELASTPLYIVRPEDRTLVTPEMLGDFDGCYYRQLDRALQPQLEAEKRWKGPGIAIVVSDRGGAVATIALTLHELAHWLDRSEADSPADDPYDAFVKAADQTNAGAARPASIPAALWAHGDSFTRLCCHLWYRATRMAECFIKPEWLGFGNVYPGLEMLRCPTEYVGLLYDECQHNRHRPLRTIAATRPPTEFTELWNSDLNRIFEAALATAQGDK